jgi:16S rRNA (guanine966-N2)-methyltransferase
MRIITGTLKGRKIDTPESGVIRPTSDRTKEGMFNVIAARRYFDDLRVLDLFAGSGNLGFEAISRGVKSVTFIDDNRPSVKGIDATAVRFGVATQVNAICMDISRFIQGPSQPYDLIFADPPYDYPEMHELIERVLSGGWLAEGGWFLLEHDKRHNFNAHPHVVFSKPYGRTIVTIFLDIAVVAEEPSDDTEIVSDEEE